MVLKIVRAFGVGIFLMSTALESPAQEAAPPRLETEYKLAVPAGQDETVWRWLRTHYATAKPRALGKNWTSSFGEETFRDRYFDVPDGTLLKARAGLRHRQRFDTLGQLTKQLVQFKTTDDPGGLLREELNFKLVESATATTPLLELLRPTDPARLTEALTEFGVAPADVREVFVLGQRRRRLYFQQDGEAFSTITLDSSYHADGPPAATFTEVEIELNEKRYTGASEQERARMRLVLDTLRADLLRQFPALEQDQRPKYQKLAELLAAGPGKAATAAAPASAADAPAASGGVPRPVFWIAGALLGLGLGWLIIRRQRSR